MELVIYRVSVNVFSHCRMTKTNVSLKSEHGAATSRKWKTQNREGFGWGGKITVASLHLHSVLVCKLFGNIQSLTGPLDFFGQSNVAKKNHLILTIDSLFSLQSSFSMQQKGSVNVKDSLWNNTAGNYLRTVIFKNTETISRKPNCFV